MSSNNPNLPVRAVSRRDFVKLGLAAGLSARMVSAQTEPTAQTASTADLLAYAAPPMEQVRIAMVGVGSRGTHHIHNLLRLEGIQIRAVCDIVEERAVNAQNIVEQAGQARPAAYTRGDHDFVRLCAEEEVDLIYTATPWEWHAPVCVAAMENGKHAATEVPAAVTVDECWQMVETAEKQRRHCIMVENCCYGRTEMTVLNMVRQGLLGELVHAECGYLHDIRSIFLQLSPGREWFQGHAMKRNGSLYSTHGLGPVAQCMDINRGDTFDYLVSLSSSARGIAACAAAQLPDGDPRRSLNFISGDVNTTLIKTALGRTITVVYNCNTPRPYSRINTVQGVKGIVRGYPDEVYIEGESPDHTWEPMDKYWERYEPKLWREYGRQALELGHGGMDYFVNARLIECLRAGLPLDMDVYDAAAWSAISDLSERSVANRGATMDIPDFTRGAWKNRPSMKVPGA